MTPINLDPVLLGADVALAIYAAPFVVLMAVGLSVYVAGGVYLSGRWVWRRLTSKRPERI